MRHALRLTTVFVWVLALGLLAASPVTATNTPQTLPFSQNWTNIGLITANDDWSGVPGIVGFRGDNLTPGTGTDPQTILADETTVDVNANQTNPVTFATGGATEFHLADPVVALTGSGTADAPFLTFYLNTTGQSGVTVTYNLRDIEAGADDAVQPVALQFRVGNSGNFTNVPAGFVADATLGTTATQVTPVCAVLPAAANNQAEVQVRVITSNAVGNDEWVGVDDIVVNTAGCGVGLPVLSVNDVSVTEGNAGTVTATFTVSLNAPAGPGGVTFDIATADGTATDANNDYEPLSLTGQTIPAGSSTYAFNVTVNGDPTPEPNETFFVNVSNVTGATVGDGQGQGTINNDDVTLTPIHDIQGPGSSSPIVGSSVTTRGVVTGVKSNGFFIQEPDATVDADPATSEGILIFTSSAPPAAAALGALVQVTGTVAEFVPTQDPFQPPLTELTSPTVVQISTGNPMPAPVALTATFPDPAGPFDQLERLEGMRVSLASLTVGGPTLGNVNEANATATSSGVFFGTVTGVPRSFREPGIQAPNPAPSGTIPPIPRWDSNPELIRVDSDGQVGGPLLDVGHTAVVTGLVGPLDYTFRRYTILPDPATPPAVAGGPTPVPVSVATSREFTVGAYNLERFFDTVNDPGIGEPVLTATAFNNRLNKASLAIRNFLRTPDILGVIEVENLTTLQALAARISSDAIAASQPDPQYSAFLVEGNDVGGIDVGFLVKAAPVVGSTPRVTVVTVVQENAGELFVNPDSSTELLNDRPSLRLNAVVNHAGGATYPVTVIVNHLRSLNGVEDPGTGSNGWATAGARVRAKRQAQAVSLANLVQARQTADPNERIILVGDFNAFEFNDGLGDSMGTIEGTPVPDNETAVPGDGADLVNPDLDNLFDTAPAAERYSFIFDGHAQSLDHVVINEDVISSTVSRRVEHPRINADFPEIARNNTTDALRLADHDPVVSFYEVAGFAAADLSVTKTDSPDPVVAGNNLTYTVTVGNAGPDPAATASWSDTLPAGTSFVSLPAVAGWSCTTPAVGAGGTVSCSNASFAVGSAVFTLTVAIDPSVASGTVISNTATATSTTSDPTPGNNSATATTTVATSADLVVTKVDTPDPVGPGGLLGYTITLTNSGPSNAEFVSVEDALPAGTTFQSLTAPMGWTCTTPAVDTNGLVSCSIDLFSPGTAVFDLVVRVDAGTAAGTVLTNTAEASAETSEGNPGDESGTATTTVAAASAALSILKVDTPDPVEAGTSLVYTITVNNEGPAVAADAELSDTLPVGTTFESLAAPAGWSCTTPAVGAGGTVTCTIATFPVGSEVFTLTVLVDAGLADGTVLSNTATITSSTPDPAPGNESATAETTVAAPTMDFSITKTDTPDPVVNGGNLTYTLTATNNGTGGGKGEFKAATVSDTLPAGTTFVSLAAPAGWTCTTPPVGGTGTVSCSIAPWLPGSDVFDLVVQVGADVPGGTTLANQASLTVTDGGRQGTETASATTLVLSPAVLSGTKTVAGTFQSGSNVIYTVVLTNDGMHTQFDNPGPELTDELPAGLTLAGATADSGTATANVATRTVTWDGSLAPGASVTITITATITGPPGTTLSNQGTISYDADGDGANEATAVTDDPEAGGADDPTVFEVQGSTVITEIPTLDTVGLALLAALLAFGGALLLRRRRA